MGESHDHGCGLTFTERALVDCGLSLPIILMKNRLQAGVPFTTQGTLAYTWNYTISTIVGYKCMEWRSASDLNLSKAPNALWRDVWLALIPGATSAGCELLARPYLTNHRATKFVAGCILLKECCYWIGMYTTNILMHRHSDAVCPSFPHQYLWAAANQFAFVCGLGGVLDVCLGKGIVLGWKTGGDATRWLYQHPHHALEFRRLLILSVLPRCVSGIAIPMFAMSL